MNDIWKEAEEAIADGTFHLSPDEALETKVRRLHAETECIHVRNECAQLLIVYNCGNRAEKAEIRERAEAILAGLIHQDRVDM